MKSMLECPLEEGGLQGKPGKAGASERIADRCLQAL
jgi:hypothetical protein